MLKRINVRNFQSIENLTINLSPGVTVITGPSRSGKSALFRAIRSAAINKPGKRPVTFGKTQAIVSMEFDDVAVSWYKGTQNKYVVEKGGAIEEYAKLADLPAAVSKAIGFLRALEGDQDLDLNFVGQWSMPFLLSLPGAKRSQVLGSITRLDEVLKAIDKAKSDNRLNQLKMNEVVAAQATLESEVTKLELSALAVNPQVTKLQSLKKEIQVLQDQKDSLERLLQTRTRVLVDLSRSRRISQESQPILEKTKKIVEAFNIWELLRKLEVEKGCLKALREIALKSAQVVSSLRTVSLIPIGFSLEILSKVEPLCCSYETAKSEIRILSINRNASKQKLEEVTAKLKEIDACPLCHRPF